MVKSFYMFITVDEKAIWVNISHIVKAELINTSKWAVYHSDGYFVLEATEWGKFIKWIEE